ncbi:MAG TPA: site-specific DNA-methyltransferase [Acidimicrobiales bacterium]
MAKATPAMNGRPRRPTATSNFGVSKRENHDASAFYRRFVPPAIDDDDRVLPPFAIDDPVRNRDARHMDDLPDGSVALVVTSPPYFAGKQYEEELRDGVPRSYGEYLQLLTDVFAECKRKLEPGGRIAVNVANLGRKPYRSLAADVIAILQDELGLLLRGEVVWQKGEGATGSCAWGSFRSAANPTLRDLTERVVIASKGRFDRARSVRERRAQGLPHRSTVTADEFMAATLDVWQIPPESAKRVDHPAPFPVELPERLILLNTFEDDLVLDPFLGSGSTLVAAARHGRRYVGYDLDPGYCAIAERRLAAELARLGASDPARRNGSGPTGRDDEVRRRAAEEGKAVQALAERVLADAGFRPVAAKRRLRGLGLDVSLVMDDAEGRPWMFELTGGYTVTQPGLRRTETVLRALGKAHVIAGGRDRLGELRSAPLVLLTSHLPRPGSDSDRMLRAAGPSAFFDAIEILDDEGFARLRAYAAGRRDAPLPGFWTDDQCPTTARPSPS